jgi:hypothetical protein
MPGTASDCTDTPTDTARAVLLITLNRPRRTAGTVIVMASSGGGVSSAITKKNARRNWVLVSVAALLSSTTTDRTSVSAASSSPAWSLMVTSFWFCAAATWERLRLLLMTRPAW